MRRTTLFTLGLGAGLWFLTGPDTPFYRHPWFYLGLSLWFWCFLVSLHHTLRRGWPAYRVPWPLLLLTALLILGAVRGNGIGQSKVMIWVATCLPLLIWPTWARVSPEDIPALAWGQMLAGLTAAPILLTLNRVWFGRATYLAIALFAGLAVLSGLFLARQKTLWLFSPFARATILGSTIVATLGLLLSGARATLAAVVVAVLVLFVFSGKAVRPALAVMAFVALMVAIAPSLWRAEADVLGERFARAKFDEGVAVRLAMAEVGIEAVTREPLLGIGAGRLADDELFRTLRTAYPHSILIELAAEFGLPAVFLFVLLLHAACVGFWRSRIQHPAVAALGLACLAFLFVNALKMFDLDTHRQLYLWMGIGLAFRAHYRRPTRPAAPPSPAVSSHTSPPRQSSRPA